MTQLKKTVQLMKEINYGDFANWLVEEYRMHVEEFNGLSNEEKTEVINQYQNN